MVATLIVHSKVMKNSLQLILIAKICIQKFKIICSVLSEKLGDKHHDSRQIFLLIYLFSILSANYRGCSVYKELLKRFKNKQTAKSAPPVFTMHKTNFAKINNVKRNEKSSASFPDAFKSSCASTNTRKNSVGLEA